MPGFADGEIRLYYNPELGPSIDRDPCRECIAHVGHHGQKYDRVNSVNDQWCFTADGIPSVSFWGWNDWFKYNLYHGQYDSTVYVDWNLSRFTPDSSTA